MVPMSIHQIFPLTIYDSSVKMHEAKIFGKPKTKLKSEQVLENWWFGEKELSASSKNKSSMVWIMTLVYFSPYAHHNLLSIYM